MTLAVDAPAKINLDLRVLGRRADGFYELRTLLQTVDLTDELQVSPAPAGVLELRVEPEGIVPVGMENLVLRAAEALRRSTGTTRGASLELCKRIPVGAGLGGGSSDAAATLVLLNSFWDLGLGNAALEPIAAALGSDVTFFLHGGLALATGRGEIIRLLPDLGGFGVVVCTPPIEVSTAEVFSLISQLTLPGANATVEAFAAISARVAAPEPPWGLLANDLEPVVVRVWPEVGRVVDRLRGKGSLHAAVTGSGSTAYAIYPDLATARDAARVLGNRWRVDVGLTLGRDQGRLRVREVGSREEVRR
jgi:4-diphosphocytidyl-2-C-methyl-D-erythritol kinase